MKNQIEQALAHMQDLVVFEPKKHVYQHRLTGEWLQGVSSVSSIVPKDWLAAWGAKEAVKALGYNDYGDLTKCENVLANIREMSPTQFLKYLKDVKSSHAKKSKEALVDGKAGHAWMEEYVKCKIEGRVTPVIPIGTPLERPIRQFKAWEATKTIQWIASEKYVVHEAKSYAGQFDAIAIIDGKLCLIDFKFAAHVSEDYYLQTAGYCAAFESHGITFDERIIMRFPKTEQKETYNPVTHKYSMIPNDFEVRYVPTRYTDDRDAFYAALRVKSWINSNTK